MPVSNSQQASSRLTEIPVSTPDHKVQPTALPRLAQLAGGPGMERHKNLYDNVFGAAVSRRLRTVVELQKTSLPADSSTTAEDQMRAKHKAARKELGSAALMSATAATLVGEMKLHFTDSLNKHPARVGLGYAQKTVGLAGMAYYASKFKEDPNPRTAALTLGYTLFNLEGFARMWEAQKSNLPKTGIAGMGSAFVKMFAAHTMLGTFAYAADFFANAVESRHGTARPKEKGFARALWNLGHSMKREHIAGIQGTAAFGMIANAGLKINKYLSTKPATDEAKDQSALQDAEFDKKFENFMAKLDTESESEFHQKVIQICDMATPEEAEEEFVKLLDTCRE